jgi:hypothetical protein
VGQKITHAALRQIALSKYISKRYSGRIVIN